MTGNVPKKKVKIYCLFFFYCSLIFIPQIEFFYFSKNTPKRLLIFVCRYKSFWLKKTFWIKPSKKKKRSQLFFEEIFLNQTLKKRSQLFFWGNFYFLGNPANPKKRSQIFKKNLQNDCTVLTTKNTSKRLFCPEDKKHPQNDCFVLKTKNTPKRLLILGEIFQKNNKLKDPSEY